LPAQPAIPSIPQTSGTPIHCRNDVSLLDMTLLHSQLTTSCICCRMLAESTAAPWLPATQGGKFHAAQLYPPSVFRHSCRLEPAY
jgi:hypothetical protein